MEQNLNHRVQISQHTLHMAIFSISFTTLFVTYKTSRVRFRALHTYIYSIHTPVTLVTSHLTVHLLTKLVIPQNIHLSPLAYVHVPPMRTTVLLYSLVLLAVLQT